MNDYVIGKLMGGLGNQFYQIATSYAYARKHKLAHYLTSTSQNCDKDAYLFRGMFPTMDFAPNSYEEKQNSIGHAIYQDIPAMKNVILIGYWQSFDYFNDYREQLIDIFNLPYELNDGLISVHVSDDTDLSIDYYKNCILYFYDKGYRHFKIYSDDILWCKTVFTDFFYPENIIFNFSEGKTELENFSDMASCEHNILSSSSYSFASSWFNRNPNKIVLCPDEHHLLKGHNEKMIPNDYIKIYS